LRMAPDAEILAARHAELKYLLRAYDSKGNFDETDARPLRLYREQSPAAIVTSGGRQRATIGRLRRARPGAQQIRSGNGHGEGARQRHTDRHTVWVAGRKFRRPAGNFAQRRSFRLARIASKSGSGRCGHGSLYLRDLESTHGPLYVGIADLTAVQEQHERVGKAAGKERTIHKPYDSPWMAG